MCVPDIAGRTIPSASLQCHIDMQVERQAGKADQDMEVAHADWQSRIWKSECLMVSNRKGALAIHFGNASGRVMYI